MKRFLILLCCTSLLSAKSKKQEVLDHLFAQTTQHLFNVEDENFLLKMAYDDNQLVYRAVYPFLKIERAGVFKASTKITNKITISASDVTLDLNGNTVTGGIELSSNISNVTIKNGIIDTTAADGLKVNSDCSNIFLSELTVRNATTNGIMLNGVDNCVITNCDMSLNDTGLQICNSSNVIVEDCNAIQNTTEGFCLVSSVTCNFFGCRALDTGNPNVASGADICGFASQNGYGNLFEDCMALGTGSSAVTDSDSIIAGFALLGTEACSRIINCQAANGFASSSGLTVPYGIYLQSTVFQDSMITLTAVPPIPVPDDSCLEVDWTPDGKYIAAGMRDNNDAERIRIYQFDDRSRVLTQVATPIASQIPSGDVTSVKWDPTGVYLAVGTEETTPRVRIYRFNRINNTLLQVATPDVVPGAVNKVDWRPDGRFVAVVHSTAPNLKVYEFDRVNLTLTEFIAAPDTNPGTQMLTVHWDPSGRYLVTGSTFPASMIVYRFSEANAVLSLAANFAAGISRFGVRWSPDGKFIASGGSARGFSIFEFDRDASTIALRTTVAFPFPAALFSFDWTDDGRHVVLGLGSETGSAPAADIVSVYKYDRTANSLSQVATPNIDVTIGGASLSGATSVRFSPDGCFIAVSVGTQGGVSTDPDRIKIYTGVTFPRDNVIQDNVTSCNSGNSCPGGVGICGSSRANSIIGNSSFENPIQISNDSTEQNAPNVFKNYAFVTNVYNQNFGNAPTGLENVTFDSAQPILIPDDINLRLVSSLSKACDIQTKVDELLNRFG